MGNHTIIFSDQFAELMGRCLLEFFESKRFPGWLLRDPTLNQLYFKAQVHKYSTDPSLSDLQREALMLYAHEIYYQNGGKPLPKRKISSSGVEK